MPPKTPKSHAPKHHDYTAIYRATAQGTWKGEVPALGLAATGPTLADARERLAKKPGIAAQALSDAGASLPKGIPATAAITAERMDVSLIPMGSGSKKLATASSHATRLPRPSPYVDRRGQHLLLESIVLVLDELGSTSLMTNGLTQHAISDRAVLLARAREWLGEGATEDLESVVVYTDNLVHGAPFSDREEATSRLGFTVTAASHYQLELALEGTILRGGIAVGQHHQSESIVAGPALIEAHDLESKVAVYPRILLSEAAIKLLVRGLAEWVRVSDSPWVAQVLVDEDSEAFVSYLSASEDYDRGRLDQLLVVERHRDRVTAGLKATKSGGGRPYAKWRWAAEYHNYYVASQGLGKELSIAAPKSWSRAFLSIPDLLAQAPAKP